MKTSLEKIKKEAEKLKTEEKLKLIESLIRQLRQRRDSQKKGLDLSTLYGLGKGLWDGEDAQDYVNRLREDRV
jgi:hypothetical protein